MRDPGSYPQACRMWVELVPLPPVSILSYSWGKRGFVTSGENLRVLSEMFNTRRSPSSLGETWGSGVGMQGGFSRWSLFYSLGS